MKSPLKELRNRLDKLQKLEARLKNNDWSVKYSSIFEDEDELTETEIYDLIDEIGRDIVEVVSILSDRDYEEEYFGERNYFNLEENN